MNMRQLLPLLLGLFISATALADGFTLEDHKGEYLDVLLDNRVAARYMYAHDNSSPQRRLETYKPYLHVFDADGKEPITKGPGGEYTHHRGIFIGWMKISFNGKIYDRWHMDTGKPVQGEIVHQQFTNAKAGPTSATFTSITTWNDENGKPILGEERTMAFQRGGDAGRLIIDFTSRLTAAGDLTLDGDPEHAGVHFRPSDDVDRSKTVYYYPKLHPNPHKDVDYPWAGETFTLKNGKTYSVIEMAHPSDPTGEHWSAYRNYGRMGAFFKHAMKAGEAIEVKYRFLIADGDFPREDLVKEVYDGFTGETHPAFSITRRPAEQSAPAQPKAAPAKSPTPAH